MSLKVLICDDAMFMRALIRKALEDAGLEVVADVGGGAEAVQRYQDLQPDLVTLDMVMPGINGVETLRQIRAADPNARVLMITAVGQEQMVTEAMEAGAGGYLSKPFEAANLVDKVTALAGKSSSAKGGVA